MRRRLLAAVPLLAGAILAGNVATAAAIPPDAPKGPCTEAAKASMPKGSGHDHLAIEQHRFICGIEQVAFNSLKNELDDEVLGEMDVKGDIAGVAVAYPQAGAVFFDVSDPAQPKYLGRYRSSECEGLAVDVDCGAFIDMSHDGKLAYLAIQASTFIPGRPPDPLAPGPAQPGVEVVDVQTRLRLFFLPRTGGVHTARSHVIPDQGGPGPRAPGEYVFAQAAGGISVAKVTRGPGGTATLQPVGNNETTVAIDEVHDMFVQNDPIDGRTYMYIASGFDSGFYVFDVTDPAQAKLVAEWDLTPHCQQDWYSHTIDVTHRGSRRYVTMPAELFRFDSGWTEDEPPSQAGEDDCEEVAGNGDRVGPMWIVDASDFSKLGPADSTDTRGEEAATEGELRQKSKAALVTTWTNAADRVAQNLRFSPHNQQIVGDKIYLSNYHAGVTVLDASGAFSGGREQRPGQLRPAELAFVVPSGPETRPIYEQPVEPLLGPFFSTFTTARPLIWDLFFHKGHLLAADMVGGFYSYRELPVPPSGGGPGGRSGQPPGTGGGGALLGRKRFLISRRAVRMSRRGVVGIAVSCRSTVPCRGTLRLRTAKRFRTGRRTSRIILGRKSFNVRGKGRATLKLRLSARNRRLVARSKRTRVLAIANVGATGAERKFTVTVGFRLARSGR